MESKDSGRAVYWIDDDWDLAWLHHRFMPMPGLQRHRDRLQFDGFGGAHFLALAAGGAGFEKHHMDLLRCPHDRIGWAHLEAARAADADLFLHFGEHRHTVFHIGQVRLDTELQCQSLHDRATSGRAQRDRRIAVGQCLRGTRASGETALSALRTRQDGLYLSDQRIAFYFQMARGIAEEEPKG